MLTHWVSGRACKRSHVTVPLEHETAFRLSVCGIHQLARSESPLFVMSYHAPIAASSSSDAQPYRLVESDIHVTAITFQVKNNVVLWDRIIRRKEDARINIEGGKNKYVFRDFNQSFRCVRRSAYPLVYRRCRQFEYFFSLIHVVVALI